MTRGRADWSQINQSGDVDMPSDLAELAVRNGSIYRHFRSGKVLYMTSFEDSDKSYLAFGQTGGSIEDYTSLTQSGANALALKTSISAEASANWRKTVPMPQTTRIGLQYSANAKDNRGEHSANFTYYSGTETIQYRLSYNRLTYVWRATAGGSFNNFLTQRLALLGDTELYDVIKMVVNLESLTLEQVIINSVVFDVDVLHTGSSPSTNSSILRAEIILGGNDGVTDQLNIDDIIITDQEIRH